MLWHNNGDGTFTDLSKETGTCDTLWGWAAKFGDFDNDGWHDLFVVNGLRSAGPGELHPGAGEDDHQARRRFHRREQLAGHRQHDLERLSEEEAVPQPRRPDVQGDLGRGRVWTTTRTAAASAWRTSTTTAGSTSIRPTPTRRRCSIATSRPGAGNWVELKLVGHEVEPRRHRRARHACRPAARRWIREVDGGNGYAGQSTHAPPLRPRRRRQDRLDRDPLAERRRPRRSTAPIDQITTIREAASNAAR